MKCQILFSGKNKKNISKCWLLNYLPSILRTYFGLYYLYFIVRVIELSSLLQSVILVIINIFYVILTCVIVLLQWSNYILACYLLPVEAFHRKEFSL